MQLSPDAHPLRLIPLLVIDSPITSIPSTLARTPSLAIPMALSLLSAVLLLLPLRVVAAWIDRSCGGVELVPNHYPVISLSPPPLAPLELVLGPQALAACTRS